MLRIVVMVSGGGTNLQAIIDGLEAGTITNTQIAGVISNNPRAYALTRAREQGIATYCVAPKEYPDRESFNQALMAAIASLEPDLIVLAGFLVVLPQSLTQAYQNRIINIHPSLIPAFSGSGYYGLKVHEAALQRGVKVTGATVHFVDEGTDTGPILLQETVMVSPDDTPESLQRRVMEEVEWQILPQAIDLIAQGRVTIVAGKAVVSE